MSYKLNQGQKPSSYVTITIFLFAGLGLWFLINVSNLAYGQELTRYNTECGLPQSWLPETTMKMMVNSYGSNTSTWPADDREFFECLTVIEVQEGAGTNNPFN